MNKSKNPEEMVTPDPYNQHHNHLQFNRVSKHYCPPLIICLDIKGIKGGQGSRVLEATGGLMTSPS